jgi:hypothetical protein
MIRKLILAFVFAAVTATGISITTLGISNLAPTQAFELPI